MSPALNGILLPWVESRFFLADGTPNAGGSVQFLAAGTDSAKATYAEASLDPSTENDNPLRLDAEGRPESGGCFLTTGAYDVLVFDADDTQLYSYQGVEAVAETAVSQLGIILATGASEVSSGYTVLASDNLLTVDSTGGDSPCVINLPAATERVFPLTIKNLGDIELAITPNGTDTIDTLAAPYTVDAAASPLFPSILIVSDGSSAWYVLASHG